MDRVIDEAASLYAKYGARDLDLLARKLGLAVYELLDAEHLSETYFPRLGAVMVKPGLPSYLRRFLVGHALGHHVLHRKRPSDYLQFHMHKSQATDHAVERLEHEADLFVACLLVPGEKLRPMLRHPWFKQSADPVLELAIEFQIPPEAMRIRLVSEGYRSSRHQQ